jgi:F-type H+-transporting ATPase subunit c
VRRFSAFVFVVVMALLLTSPVFAQQPTAGGGLTHQWVVIIPGVAMAFASGVCGFSQSKAIAAACEGFARNPGAAPAIRFALLLGLAFIESLALFTFLIIFLRVY